MYNFITRLTVCVIFCFFLAFNASANDSDQVNCNRAWKMVVLGSSTAYGTGASVYDSSWVGKFTAYVKRKNSQSEVYNFGIPGYTTYQNLCPTGFTPPANRPTSNSSFNITAALNLHPDAIIINMPSNDAANDYSIAEQQANFERAIHLADSANIPVWVTTTQPRNNMSPAEITSLITMRDWIKTRFADKAVDFWSPIANADGTINAYYDYDYVHVNNAGHDLFYKRMKAETILDSLCIRVTQTLVARAGNDISSTLPANAVLDGSASYSSLGGIITSYQWTVISGPGNAVITSSSSAIAGVTNLSEGRYSFALTVTDNASNVKSDTVNLVVSSRILIDFGPDLTTSPDVNNNYWNTITEAQPGIKLTNAVTTGNVATSIGLQVVNRIDGTFNVAGPGTNTGNSLGGLNDYPATATSDFSFAEPSATNGQWKITGLESTKQYTIKFWGTRSVSDDRIIQVKRADQSSWQEYNASNNSNYDNAAIFTFSGKTEMSFDIRVKSGSSFGYICLIDISRTTPAVTVNVPPFARANDVTVPLPATSGVLDASASGDDDGVIMAWQWIQTSGPSTADIASPNSAVTALNNLIEGIYTFRLSVTDDSSAVAIADVMVTVNSRVLFDFGANSTTGPDAGGKYWNNIADGLTGIKIQNAVNSGNTPTTLSLEIINRIDGTFNTDGPGTNTGNINANVGDYPASATADYAFAHNSATNGSWKIAGLDVSKQYTIKFWGTRDAADDRVIQIKPADDTVWQEYDARNNSDYNNAAVFTFTGKSERYFDIRVKDNNTFGHISLIDIKITNPPINCSPAVSITSDQVAASCSGSPISFSAVVTNGGTLPSYQWKKNGINISGLGSATYIATDLNNNDSISCVITANTNCGYGITATSNTVAAAILPAVVMGNISGPTDPCAYIDNPNNAVYTVAPIANVNNYTWTVPAGATIVSGQGTTGITVSYNSNFGTTGIISVTGGDCSNAIAAVLNLIKNTPAPPAAISGPVSACPFLGTTTQATYSIAAVSFATSYVWTVPANVTIVSGQGTTSINVLFSSSFTTSQISVKAISNCATSKETGLTISAIVIPAPGVISGPVDACPYIGTQNIATYTIRKVPGATLYVWTVPAGAVIASHPGSSGVNDTIITVTYNSSFVPGSAITVQAGGCLLSAPSSLTIQRILPNAPGIISGPTDVCPYIDATATYTIRKVAGVSAYIWAVPAGVTIASHPGGTGINDTIIKVSYTSSVVSGSAISVQSAGCIPSAASSLTILKLAPATPGIISGPTDICIYVGSVNTATYTIRKVTGATSYIWSVPAGASISSHPAGSGVNDTTIKVTYTSSLVSGSSISVQASSCVTSAASSLAVLKVAPATPGVISGPTDICIYIGTTNTATYTIRKVTGATSYIWSVPAGASISSHPAGSGVNDTTIKVSYTSSLVSGSSISVQASSCVTSAASSLAVLKTAPATPGVISGPTEACAYIGTTNTATYSIRKVTGATSYIWTVPAGVTISSHPGGTGANDTTIKVLFNSGFVTGSAITVKASSCLSSAASSLTILRPLPAAPGPINVLVSPCKYQLYAPVGGFSIAKVPGVTYTWNAPLGSTIYHGSATGTSDSVGIVFPLLFTSGTVSVTASNGCGSNPVVSSVNVQVVVPATLSLNLTGPGDPCPYVGTGNGATYKVNKVAGIASYTWTTPSTGVTVVHPNGAGINDTIIIVTYTAAFTTGSITVTANTVCGSSPVKTINLVKNMPATPGTITTTLLSSCPNRKYTYSISSLPANATSVTWTVPAGATIVSGQGTTTLTVTYTTNGASGNLLVYGKNNCGNSSSARTLSINLPKCTGGRPGNNEPEIAAITKEELPAGLSITVMPNPSYNDFKMIIKSNDLQSPVLFQLRDINGKLIETRSGIMTGQMISIGTRYKPGIYIGEFIQGDKRSMVKLIKL